MLTDEITEDILNVVTLQQRKGDNVKILVTPTSLQPGKKNEALDRLREFSNDLVFNPTGRPLTEEELLPLIGDCDGYIAGVDFVTEKVIAAATRLKVISRYGAGVDRVDLEAAKVRGVLVTNTPGANAQAVAELAIGLVLSVARRIPHLDRTTRSGEWIRSSGIELKGKTLGILGLGAIGKCLARIAAGFDMEVMAYDPFMNEEYAKENGIAVADRDEVIARADVLSLHVPMTRENRHMIDKAAIETMRPGAILINASRGGLIDEEAAYEALVSGKLGGMGLDAFEVEPPGETKLFTLPNVVVTPHTGAHTAEATTNMATMAVDNLIEGLTTGESRYQVNK